MTLDFEYPDANGLNQFLAADQVFLAIPHHVILYVLWGISFILLFIAFVAIIFTRKFPRGCLTSWLACSDGV